ncbi:hypothetical protein OFN97_06200 [Campylobacter sp. VBCF_05 NA6]|uniref:hypothetical protein n=1 Tax=unclassified Campylobacter TaxID=2593542 RepID=UPI0022E9DB3A|nr:MULTISPECIES: hypothetical protein [unclassified Campylobacter]MDA3057030.1 hypothetical protein [Campylobacter sp. VBCF_04 NA7]MDA3059603.1 hypothetical protein [Campylobacter sp. VBCF_05 NA6]
MKFRVKFHIKFRKNTAPKFCKNTAPKFLTRRLPRILLTQNSRNDRLGKIYAQFVIARSEATKQSTNLKFTDAKFAVIARRFIAEAIQRLQNLKRLTACWIALSFSNSRNDGNFIKRINFGKFKF